ncbi:MAG: S8 family serine peptidase [Bacteroidota bacterium]
MSKSAFKGKTALQFTFHPFKQSTRSASGAFPWMRYTVIKFNQQPSAQLLTSISGLSGVEFIQLNNIYTIKSLPNDSAYPSLWNLRRIRINNLWENGTLISSLPTVKVGVIDTGIDEDHPDLKNMIALNPGESGGGKETNGIDDDGNGFIDDWRGYDFVDGESKDEGDWNTRDNDPMDENGHGTSVSGIISAQTNNGIGIAGISQARLMPLRAFGKGGNGTDIDIASAIIYAADNGADVINMSFGDVIQSPFLHDAIRYAYSKNVVLVASSGNDGSNYPHYPSDFSEVISTGSVGQYDVRSFFSSNSPSLDIMAPGEQIVTTTMGGGYTDQFAGTSAAAPHVSGVAALIKGFQKKKKSADPSFIEFKNEEIRGILLNSADDAGEPGWDKFYASGIVNAERALTAAAGSVVQVLSPGLDENISTVSIPVIVNAVSPYIERVDLYYGIGDAPSEWIILKSVLNRIFIRDTLFNWNVTPLIPNIYQLRLVVKNSKGNDVESRQRIVIDGSSPAIISFRYRDSVIASDDHVALVEARIDRNSTANLYYRKVGESVYKSIASGGLQLNHSFVLSSHDFLPNSDYEFYCLFTENSGVKRSVRFPNTSLVGFDHFQFRVDNEKIQTSGFTKKSFGLPAGFLLNSVQTIQGKKYVILNEYKDNAFGTLKAYQFTGSNFQLRDSSIKTWVPRSFTSSSGGSKPMILVQDRGTSELLQIDTVSLKFFSETVWGDSTDVWASQFVDLNGDSKPEIVARTSTEYIVYRNLGNNKFSIAAHLPNPTSPMSGEAKNQFGPPRSIVGDFTASGRQEIIFADYDGDIIAYRQSAVNSLTFNLAWVDTSDLNEMSDYITAGDFNGDGIQDFAVAGHSDLGWNQDREYNVPVWNLRVFSHLPTDNPQKISKIWEQNFLGVRSGSGYDNGIISGKLRSTDTQDALFISFNPQLYVFAWDPVRKTFISRWMHESESNSLIIDDFDGDSYADLGFQCNGRTEFWSMNNTSVIAPPYGLSSVPISSSKIRLHWNSLSATNKVYRGTKADSLLVIASISGTEWIDSTVSGSVKYFYAVTAQNVTESALSEKVSVIPHNAPMITSVVQSSRDQLTVGISFDVSSSDLFSASFVADGSAMNSSSIVWKSSRLLLLTFPQPFIPGTHTLRIRHLTDASGMNADTTNIFPFTASITEEKSFFARSVAMISPRRIEIVFNEAPDFKTAKDPLNYLVKTSARTFSIVSIDSVSPVTIGLNFASGSTLNSLALRIEASLDKNITSFIGASLNSGKGQVLSIAQEAQNIDHVAVYPNPAKNSGSVSFANLPSNCRITVYSPNGNKIKAFNELTGREGIAWDLRDEQGNIVSTGIYLYRIEQLGSANEILNTTLGKFAVIR